MADSEDDIQDDDETELDDEDEGLVHHVMRSLELTEGVEIARRYLAMNAFDGALTMLGLILGSLIAMHANVANADLIFKSTMLASFGTCLAMAVSGFSGSYLTESAERDREVDEIGKAMLSDMTNSMYAKATRVTSIVVALIDGLSPSMAALFIITPLMLVPFGVFDYYSAFYVAIGMSMLLLFILGIFLGTVSGKNKWSYGAKTLLAGILTAAFMFVVSILTEAAG